MKNKSNKGLALGLALALILLGRFAQAQEAPAVSTGIPDSKAPEKSQMTVLADVNFRSPMILSHEGNKLNLFFILENSLDQSEAGIRYGIQLIKEKTIFDEKIYSEDILSVSGNSFVQKMIDYTAPDYLAGDFELWLVAKNESGLPLALYKLESPVKLFGSGDYLEVDTKNCQLEVSDDKDKKAYTLSQGVSLKSEEELIFSCSVISHFKTSTEILPILNTYERSLFGKLIKKDETGATFLVKSGEKKTIKLRIEKPTVAQAYEVRLSFQKDGQDISRPINFHYVVAGQSATIQKLDLNKSAYQQGEMIKATLRWSGPADNFDGSRTEKTGKEATALSLKMTNQNDQLCADILKKNLDLEAHTAKLEFSAKIACADPKVTVTLKDAQGTVLAERTFDYSGEDISLMEDEQIAPKSVAQSAQIKTLAILAGVIISLLLILGIFLVRKTNLPTAKKVKKILPILLLALFGLNFQRAEALTLGYSSSWSSNNISISLNKTSYSPSETIYAYASGSYWEACDNVPNWMMLTSSCGGQLIYAGGGPTVSGSGSCTASSVSGTYNVDFTNELIGEEGFSGTYQTTSESDCLAANNCESYATDGTCISGKACYTTEDYPAYLDCSDRTNLRATFCPLLPGCNNCTTFYSDGVCASTEVCATETTYFVQQYARNYAKDTGSVAYTVIAPTAPAPPTANVTLDKPFYLAGETVTVSWTTNAAIGGSLICGSGPPPYINAPNLLPNGSTTFQATKTGLLTCVFTPRRPLMIGIPDFVAVTVFPPGCFGAVPDGVNSIMCPGDADPAAVIGHLVWQNVGSSVANCTPTRKCEYFAPWSASAICGTANRNFLATETDWGGETFCNPGVATPTNPVFPSSSSTTTWQCKNGTNVVSCTATRACVPTVNCEDVSAVCNDLDNCGDMITPRCADGCGADCAVNSCEKVTCPPCDSSWKEVAP